MGDLAWIPAAAAAILLAPLPLIGVFLVGIRLFRELV